MTLRVKLLAVIIPAVALTTAACAYAYLRGTGAVENLLRADAEARASFVARRVGESMRVYESHLARLAASPSMRAYVRDSASAQAPSDDVRTAVIKLFGGGEGPLAAITCVRREGKSLFRAGGEARDGGRARAEPQFQTAEFITSTVRCDERVWALRAPEALRSPVSPEAYGSGVRTTVPVFAAEDGASPAEGALVMELELTSLFEDAAGPDRPAADAERGATWAGREQAIVAVDVETGHVVYHTNKALMNQPAVVAMPYFEGVRARMAKNESGSEFYEAPDGDRWLASFRRVEGTNVSVAGVGNYTSATADVRLAGWLGVALSLLAGALAVAFTAVITSRASRHIGRVAEGAAAIAGGDLDRRVSIETSGETRALAESFNLMGDRLREHIRREAETKQFESFLRLSSMLTHDLKNSITGLSMLVSNMERLYDHEEFRAEAISSLRDATDKLKRIVMRLNEPALSLSGEYRRDGRPTDLVPVVMRVLAMNAVPSVPLYEIETNLPEKLIATVEPARIENVIENLVINALEAMGAKGGRLTVEAGEAGEGLVFFSVSDTGVGMSDDFIRERLFRPFATTKKKGIGLGLYTCREVVEAHGGRLEVESWPGVGTRFRVVLPSDLFTSRERRKQTEKRVPAAVSGERGV